MIKTSERTDPIPASIVFVAPISKLSKVSKVNYNSGDISLQSVRSIL